MTDIGFATLQVIPSVKGMRRELEQQTGADLTAAGRSSGKKYGDAAGKEASAGFKSRMSSSLKGFNPLAGLAVGAGAVVLFKDAISGASDLAESTSKAKVVFGQASDAVLKFGADASSSIGQSEAQALEATGTFGNLLRSVGLSEDVAAKFSTTMVGLASDLASFNNTSIDDALEALRSGLVGETEPLKRFGVNMNEAVLKAKALELGLSDGKAVLDSNAKAQAAYAVIMEQTTLAQGDFARTQGGLANQSKKLSAQWSEMTTELGQNLLPAATEFVTFLNDKGLPALSSAGGVAKDAVVAFSELPSPVLAAAAAFAALKIASATGLPDGVGRAATTAGSAMEGLRIRTMLAADAYRLYRTNVAGAVMANGKVIASNGRAAASMAALRAASVGAGAGIKKGLSGASALVGGPWGAAFIVGIAAVTHFWQEHQKAKQRVDELTESLNAQTGELTKNTSEKIFANLQDSGAVEAARKIGLSLADLQLAAEGNAAAMLRVDTALDQIAGSVASTRVQGAAAETAGAVNTVRDALGDADGELAISRQAWLDHAAAMDQSATASGGAGQSLAGYRTEIAETRTELQKLIEKEQERALNAIQNRRDSIALIETFKAAQKEAGEGKRTLDENTKAGRENMTALLDLADQWGNSAPKVQNAKGAYEDMRRKFIGVTTSMGATKDEAIKLADELLKVPKTAPIKFQSEGYQERIREIRELRREAREAVRVNVQILSNKGIDTRPALASGGLLRGPGTGTSDSILMWGSNGEFMQRKAAVDYYGVEFMRRLNALQIPRHAQGGPIGERPSVPVAASAGVSVSIGQVVAQDYGDLMGQLQRRAQRAQMDGARIGVPS